MKEASAFSQNSDNVTPSNLYSEQNGVFHAGEYLKCQSY
jgi:hypothetical protein